MPGIDITCPHCQRHFRIAPEQLRPGTLSAKCGGCMKIFPLNDLPLASAKPPPRTPGEAITTPVFLCLQNGEELPAILQKMDGPLLQIAPFHPLTPRHLQLLHKKSSLRVGLQDAAASWEYFITLACATATVAGDLLQVELATMANKRWLIVEEHGVYIFVVRSGGKLEGGWKPLKKQHFPKDNALPASSGASTSPMILCGKVDLDQGRMQFKNYSLPDILTIQRIARDRHLLSDPEDHTLPFPPTPPSRQGERFSAMVSQSNESGPVNETIFRSFGQDTESWDLSPDGAEWLTEVVAPPIAPPVTNIPLQEPAAAEDDDITVKDEAAMGRNSPATDDDHTARDDRMEKFAIQKTARQISDESKMRWIKNHL